jgi:hypothetical protein
MRLFPDREKLKRAMQKGLPLVMSLAWGPVVWMVLALLVGSPIQHMTGSLPATISIVTVAAVLATATIVRQFRRSSSRIFDNKDS